MSETTMQPDSAWEATMADLRARYPDASEGILFCVHKLQQDPNLSIRDFRDEAKLHGIGLSGRSLHSAKVLLGMQKPATRRPNRDEAPARTPRHPSRETASNGGSVENQLIAAVQQIQESATADSNRLRKAMREAVEVLQRALDGRD